MKKRVNLNSKSLNRDDLKYIRNASRVELQEEVVRLRTEEATAFAERLQVDVSDFLFDFIKRETAHEARVTIYQDQDTDENPHYFFTVDAESTPLSIKLTVEVARLDKRPALEPKTTEE